MQKLHLVGFTTDLRALILSARRGAKSGGYLLEVDDAVAAAVSDAVQRAAAAAADQPEEVAPPPPRPQSALSVRELQARLRAGRSIDEVAAEAGVEPAWVARFSAPVVAEQARVVDATRAATLSRARLGPSALPIGAAVRRALADRGVELTAEELDTAWSARQVDEGRWVVTLRYRSRGRAQTPSWELDVRSGTVKARDRLAAELGFVAGPPRPAASVAKPAKVPSAVPTDSDRVVARRVAEARKAAAAQLDEAARVATRRNAEAARRERPAPPPPEPEPAPPKAAKAAKATGSRGSASRLRDGGTRERTPTPTKKAPAARKAPVRKQAAAKKAPAKKQPADRSRSGTGRKRPAAAREPSPAPKAPRHARRDEVAERLAAVRKQAEEQLRVFESQRGGAAEVVVRTPIDLRELRASAPVFKGGVAPAGDTAPSGNGSTPTARPPAAPARPPAAPARPPAAPARPPRTRPLRAR